MSQTTTEDLGINSWLEEELYQQYLSNQQNVDSSWKTVFDTNGHLETEAPMPVAPLADKPMAETQIAPAANQLPAKPAPAIALGPAEQLMPLRGVAARKIGRAHV